VVIGAVTPKDRSMFADGVQFIADDANLAMTLIDRVRTCATDTPAPPEARTTVSG